LEPLFGVLLSLGRGTPNHGEWVVTCLEGAWSKFLGEKLAAVCRPVSFRGSQLTIGIMDAGWEEAVKNLQQDLTEKLRIATGGEVKSVVFSGAPGRMPG
jgi:hypothetical protein